MGTKQQFILLTGVPGSGKTKIGERLRGENFKFDFFPTDPDINWSEFRQEVALGVGDFVNRWYQRHGDKVCLEWGFDPFGKNSFGQSFLDEILSFKDQGAKIFWLTYDKRIAYFNYVKKNAIKDPSGICWEIQMNKIEYVGLPTSDFIIIQTHPYGKPKLPEELAREILSAARNANNSDNF